MIYKFLKEETKAFITANIYIKWLFMIGL